MKLLLVFIGLFTFISTHSQSADDLQIRSVLAGQTRAWNQGDIESFMEGYWKNDSLMFIGKSGITYGWQKTLENYKRGYPDTASMGKLSFDILLVKKLSGLYYQVIGRWKLNRSIGDLEGHFTLLFQKIKGQWLIISDHSS
ncbi:MAG TPA: nuclear transport factor 2 family protein [Chitinophagaceae bacterium]|nr:nuclear transport factor 2 family protein [Chitinophagaceae bacterium]